MEASALPRRPALPRSRRLLAAYSDDRLVEQIRRGNDAAFEAAYDRHHRGVLSFCRHMLGSPEEAEDVVQHTFAAAHRSIVADDREIRLAPWLYTIARNRCVSVLRARRERPTDPPEIATAGLAEQVERRDDLRQLLADLRDLPERQRAALVLSELGDLPHAGVAEVLGCEVDRVKSLVFQARTALMERREARAIPCSEIRHELATARGAALRRGPLRRHLKECAGCSAFRDEVRRQRRMMALLLPVAPSVGLKRAVLAASGIGGGGAAGGGLAAGGGVLGAVAGSGAAKVVTGALVATSVATGAGVAVINEPERAAPGQLNAAPARAELEGRLASSERGGFPAARRTGEDAPFAMDGAAGRLERKRAAREKQVRLRKRAAGDAGGRGRSGGPKQRHQGGGGRQGAGGPGQPKSGGGEDSPPRLPKPPKTDTPTDTPTLTLPEPKRAGPKHAPSDGAAPVSPG